jgi:glycosyltransferase involved in cell wall biosynthesis
MKKLLLISHAFHQKTKSIGFLIDLFAHDYDIAYCYVDPGDPRGDEAYRPYLETIFDLIVCIQVAPPPHALKRLTRSRMVFIPMYDHSGSWGIESWFSLRRIRIVSFSSHLTERLQAWGFDARGIQFFPCPVDSPEWGDPDKAFFWNRIEKINIGTVSELLRSTSVKTIHLHRSMDPGQTFLAPADSIRERFAITDSEWFSSKEELKGVIGSCSIYLAPRLKEGIGMSFLEAMAMGRCVIAPDLPTMNEYIVHGENGFLYNPSRIVPLSIPDIRSVQARALASIQEGRIRWERDRETLLAWCEGKPRTPGWGPWLHLALRIGLHPLKASKPWRRRILSIRYRKGAWTVHLFGWTCMGGTDHRR